VPEFVKALALLALRYGYDRRLAALRGNGLGVLRRNSAVGNDERFRFKSSPAFLIAPGSSTMS